MASARDADVLLSRVLRAFLVALPGVPMLAFLVLALAAEAPRS